jgi:predicted SAM-dependent methyltransferase
MPQQNDPKQNDAVRRLHIGGKDLKAGWEIFDAIAAGHVDHVGNARDLSRFADGTFAQLYASHVLEHFDYKDAIGMVLKEWRRVLAPGGRLCVSVPDMERLCHLYLTPRLAPEMRFHLMRMVFGGHMDEYDYHLTGLDESYLRDQLQQAGFSAIQRVPSFNLFKDSSEMQFLGMPISLSMVATR